MHKISEKFVNKNIYLSFESYIDEELNGRIYITPENEKLPSVSTILKIVNESDKIKKWKKLIGSEKEKEILKESTDIGSLVHKNIEKFIKEKEFLNGSNYIRMLAKKMAETIISNICDEIDEIWGLECSLWFSGLYAGTTDIVFLSNNKLHIGDFKTSKGRKSDEDILNYKLQTVAYALAHNKLYGTKINSTKIFLVNRNLEFQKWYIDSQEFLELENKWFDILEKFYIFVSQKNIKYK